MGFYGKTEVSSEQLKRPPGGIGEVEGENIFLLSIKNGDDLLRWSP
jgi:hypothetical protein